MNTGGEATLPPAVAELIHDASFKVDEQKAAIVHDGALQSRGMPPFAELRPEELSALQHFIRQRADYKPPAWEQVKTADQPVNSGMPRSAAVDTSSAAGQDGCRTHRWHQPAIRLHISRRVSSTPHLRARSQPPRNGAFGSQALSPLG